MNQAHTPGPWTVDGCNEKQGIGDYSVREVAEHTKYMPWSQLEATEQANARLIAAAPRMRDQLEKIAAFAFSDVEVKEGYQAALKAFCALKREARAILRDVEGGQG